MAKPGAKRGQRVLTRALVRHSPLRERVVPGLQGLESRDAGKVSATPADLVTDSLALDESLRDSQPNANRWDYLLGTQDRDRPVIGVEVHHAVASEVAAIVEKKQWAAAEAGKHFKPGHRVSAWYWVASGRTRISKNTSEWRRLVRAGITFAGARLRLPE